MFAQNSTQCIGFAIVQNCERSKPQSSRRELNVETEAVLKQYVLIPNFNDPDFGIFKF